MHLMKMAVVILRESNFICNCLRELIQILNNCADALKIDRPSSDELEEILKDLDEN